MKATWNRFRSSRWGDVPFILIGIFIGWNSDVCCAVKGRSMLPTLCPGEYIVFVPYTLLLFKAWLHLPLVHPGDVVVMKISDTLSVCKRVIKTTTSAEEKTRWESEYFAEESLPPAYLSPEDDEQPDVDGEHDAPSREENLDTRYYEWLSKGTRAHDWDTCIDRVTSPSMWLWVEGDNKDHSFDSRSAGAVPLECLRGRVFAVAYPKAHMLQAEPTQY